MEGFPTSLGLVAPFFSEAKRCVSGAGPEFRHYPPTTPFESYTSAIVSRRPFGWLSNVLLVSRAVFSRRNAVIYNVIQVTLPRYLGTDSWRPVGWLSWSSRPVFEAKSGDTECNTGDLFAISRS